MGEALLSRRAAAVLVALAWLAAVPAVRGQAAAAPRVVAIEVRSDGPLPGGRSLADLLSIRVGEPLDEQAVRRTITNLYASGVAREVEVYGRPSEGGVVAVVALWANLTVAEVRVEGQLGLKRRDVLKVVARGQGQPLVESRILRGVYDLKDLYRDSGYLEANVRVGVEEAVAPAHEAVVVYRVESGPPALLGEVGFTGDLGPFTAEELRRRSGLEVGDHYRRRAMEEAREKLRRSLVGSDRRLARVGEPTETYDGASHRMSLTIPVTVGPEVSVQVLGADRKELERKGLLPFLGRDGYDEGLLLQAVERIETWYQEKGYYRVAVTTQEERGDGTLAIELRVVPGRQYTLTGLRFGGNQKVPSDELRALVTTTPREPLRLGSGRLVASVLAADLSNLRSYYALQGFTEARVLRPRVEEEGDELSVEIPIEEGPQSRVAAIELQGLETLKAEDVRKDLAARKVLWEGGPFHPTLLDDALAAVRARYQQLGFGSVQVSARTEVTEVPPTPANANAGSRLVKVEIQVLEGEQSLIDRVIVRGNLRTEKAVILRAVDLDPGSFVSAARLLDAQRKLYRLGIFSTADVSLGPADLSGQTRDVVVRVEEGKTRRVVYGIGYDSEDGARGLVGLSSSNIAGRAFTLGADLRASQQTQSFRLTFDQPYLGPLDVPLTYTLFYLDERRPNLNLEVQRWGGRVEAIKEFHGNDRWGLIYDYRVVKPNLDLGTLDEPLPREDRQIRISSLIPNLFLDGRDDPVDPRQGWSTLVQLQYAFPFQSTTEEFLKLFVQQTQYVSLGHFGLLAASLRFGAIEPLRSSGDDPLLPPDLPSSRISIAERFFAGGLSTHRAYDRDELAIRGETSIAVSRGGSVSFEPVGGNGLAIFNLDYRFPLVGPVGGVVFLDAGNIWADWRSIDPRQAKLGLGLGVRYLSPVGPIRFEIGFKLDRDPGESAYEIHLSVGNPF